MKTPILSLCALTLAVGATLVPASFGASYTWTPTTAATYEWPTTSQNNWGTGVGGAFPNAAGDVANVNNNIAGAQFIRPNQAITIGVLNLGDADGSHGFEFSSTGGGSLTFNSSVVGTPAQLNLTSVGTATNKINVPMSLTSDLNIDMGGADVDNAQSLWVQGTLDASGRAVTISGGVNNNSSKSLLWFRNGNNLIGDANTVITNNSQSAIAVDAQPDFYGKIVLNGLSTANNLLSLGTGASGTVLNASEITINGYLSAGTTQNGGGMQVGQGSSQSVNPGQRLTQNRLTLNGGVLNNVGQPLKDAAAGQLVQDTVANFDFNSAYSLVSMSVGGGSGGTRLNITTLERSVGATGYIRSSTLGGTAQITAGNAASFLVGGGGAEGSTTMSIVPWLAANNASNSSGTPSGFATNGANGLRALTSGEYATSITAGSTANVAVASAAIAGPTTVNSLTLTAGSVSNVGTGQVLSVSSGGVFFNSNNGGIGAAGNVAAGTLNFGSAEGVVWANTTNSNGIGSVITGSGGLTKAGTGTLTLTGANTYNGDTYVSAGTLIVGNGVNASNLGLTGDVTVANGAILSLMNGGAIADNATLTLQNFGLANGMLTLGAGVNETIGSLFLGSTMFGAGTYGSTSSLASFQSDQWFAGTGLLTVAAVPEPSSFALAALGFVVVISLRRRLSRAR